MSKKSKRVSISFRPEHALQYSAMFWALMNDTQHNFHPVFNAMFSDFHGMIQKSCCDQLTSDEIKAAARLDK